MASKTFIDFQTVIDAEWANEVNDLVHDIFQNPATAAAARAAITAAESGANTSITSLAGLTSALSVVQGGTGATDAATARANLTAAASGANSDITSLSGLTTPLSVAQGGTGAADAATAASNLSVPPDSRTITAGVGLTGGGDLSANRTIDLDIPGLTNETVVDRANDTIAIYDAGATAHREMTIADAIAGIPNMSGSLISPAGNHTIDTPSEYNSVYRKTPGTTYTYTLSEGATFGDQFMIINASTGLVILDPSTNVNLMQSPESSSPGADSLTINPGEIYRFTCYIDGVIDTWIAELLTHSIKTAYKSSTESVTSSTTFQDDDHLFLEFDGQTASRWYISGIILWAQATTTTQDIKLSWSTPARSGNESWWIDWAPAQGNSGQFTTVRTMTNSWGNALVLDHTGGIADQVYSCKLEGFIGINAPGKLQLRWAQNASSANVTNVQQGSFIKATRVG